MSPVQSLFSFLVLVLFLYYFGPSSTSLLISFETKIETKHLWKDGLILCWDCSRVETMPRNMPWTRSWTKSDPPLPTQQARKKPLGGGEVARPSSSREKLPVLAAAAAAAGSGLRVFRAGENVSTRGSAGRSTARPSAGLGSGE